MTAKEQKRVSYFYDEEIGNFCYGGGNPMRPHRARMVYSLLNSYGLLKHVELHRPQPRSFEQLTEFHADGEERVVGTGTLAGVYGLFPLPLAFKNNQERDAVGSPADLDARFL